MLINIEIDMYENYKTSDEGKLQLWYQPLYFAGALIHLYMFGWVWFCNNFIQLSYSSCSENGRVSIQAFGSTSDGNKPLSLPTDKRLTLWINSFRLKINWENLNYERTFFSLPCKKLPTTIWCCSYKTASLPNVHLQKGLSFELLGFSCGKASRDTKEIHNFAIQYFHANTASILRNEFINFKEDLSSVMEIWGNLHELTNQVLVHW